MNKANSEELDDPDSGNYLVVTRLWMAIRLDGRSQKEIAYHCGISQGELSSYVTGKMDFLPKHHIALCLTLDRPPHELVGTVSLDSMELLDAALSKVS